MVALMKKAVFSLATREAIEVETTEAELNRGDDLEDVRAQSLARIDDEAERIRQKYITASPGQVLTYREKFEQAKAVVIAGQAAADALSAADMREQYPTLAASVGIEAPTLWDCAQIVVAKAEAWADLSYEIEQTRLAAKAAVTAAADRDAVVTTMRGIVWPSD